MTFCVWLYYGKTYSWTLLYDHNMHFFEQYTTQLNTWK